MKVSAAIHQMPEGMPAKCRGVRVSGGRETSDSTKCHLRGHR